MAITQFEQNAIDSAAKSHTDMGDALESRLNKLFTVVSTTLGTSPSQATRALEATYDAWIQDVKKMVVERIASLSQAMTKTAQSQMDEDEQNSRNISQVSHFITG